MVEQLGSFADEVTRLAREVGAEGKLGGQADVRGVSGTWRHLTDAVNSMANNLTEQVRNISQVSTAIARGDLTRKIVVDARGEILELKNAINVMVDQLSAFAEEVSRVAREVGTEGKLGGQASVEGVKGTWKELTDNVNGMARRPQRQLVAHEVRDPVDAEGDQEGDRQTAGAAQPAPHQEDQPGHQGEQDGGLDAVCVAVHGSPSGWSSSGRTAAPWSSFPLGGQPKRSTSPGATESHTAAPSVMPTARPSDQEMRYDGGRAPRLVRT